MPPKPSDPHEGKKKKSKRVPFYDEAMDEWYLRYEDPADEAQYDFERRTNFARVHSHDAGAGAGLPHRPPHFRSHKHQLFEGSRFDPTRGSDPPAASGPVTQLGVPPQYPPPYTQDDYEALPPEDVSGIFSEEVDLNIADEQIHREQQPGWWYDWQERIRNAKMNARI